MKPTVVVIDMLQDFFNGNLRCEGTQRLLGSLERLLKGARSVGVPVIYSNHDLLCDVAMVDVWLCGSTTTLQ